MHSGMFTFHLFLSPEGRWTSGFQFAPGTLTHQDDDRDTLLHIVISHNDLAKIYSLVEQQLKLDNAKDRRPFDVPNRYNQTPLFLAVQQQLKEVSRQQLHLVL